MLQNVASLCVCGTKWVTHISFEGDESPGDFVGKANNQSFVVIYYQRRWGLFPQMLPGQNKFGKMRSHYRGEMFAREHVLGLGGFVLLGGYTAQCIASLTMWRSSVAPFAMVARHSKGWFQASYSHNVVRELESFTPKLNR